MMCWSKAKEHYIFFHTTDVNERSATREVNREDARSEFEQVRTYPRLEEKERKYLRDIDRPCAEGAVLKQGQGALFFLYTTDDNERSATGKDNREEARAWRVRTQPCLELETKMYWIVNIRTRITIRLDLYWDLYFVDKIKTITKECSNLHDFLKAECTRASGTKYFWKSNTSEMRLRSKYFGKQVKFILCADCIYISVFESRRTVWDCVQAEVLKSVVYTHAQARTESVGVFVLESSQIDHINMNSVFVPFLALVFVLVSLGQDCHACGGCK